MRRVNRISPELPGNFRMGKSPLVLVTAAIFLAFLPAGCRSVNTEEALSGRFAVAAVAHKNFTIIGTVSASSAETHTIGPLGIVRKVEGAKITYSDLMLEAAGLDADDIVGVRIEMNTGGRTTFIDWLKGRVRVFSYTGEAIAVKYTSEKEETNEETAEPDVTDFFSR